MDPLKVFDESIAEARLLVNFYETFKTRSERNVRQSFAERANRLISPFTDKTFDNRSNSEKSYIFFELGATIDWRQLRHNQCRVLLKMAIVQAVSAMDCYFHDQIEWHFGRILSKCPDKAPRSLRDFPIPTGRVKDVVDNYERTTVGLRIAFESELRKVSIQSVRQIEGKLKIIGVTGFWGDVSNEMGVASDELKSWIGQIARQRNRIVHEGDRLRAQNGRMSRARDISADDVVDDIHVIDCFVYAMDHEIERRATK